MEREIFYIKMVSCVESLLKFEEIKNDCLENKLNKILNLSNDFNNEEKGDIKNWLINRKIKHKFLYFLNRYSKGFIKGGNKKAKHCFIKRGDLRSYLKRIYDARSSYIHTGEPMYISFDLKFKADGNSHLWDLSPDQGIYTGRRRIDGNKKLPRIRWFERIVNYSLKKFVEEKKENKT